MVSLARLVLAGLLLVGCSGSGEVDVEAFCEAIEEADRVVFESSLPVDSMAVTAAFTGAKELSAGDLSAMSELADELEDLAVEMDAAYKELGVIDPALADDVDAIRELVAAQFQFLADAARGSRTGDEVVAALNAMFGGGAAPEEIAEWVETGGAGFDRINEVAWERCEMVIDGQ